MKDLRSVLNAHFLAVLSGDVSNGSMDGVVDYAGLLTGLLVGLSEKADEKTQEAILIVLKNHGVDFNVGITLEEMNKLLQVDEELPDNVVRIH